MKESSPLANECARPLQALSEHDSLNPFFSCVLSEFRDARVTWQEVVPFDESHTKMTRNPLKLEIFVWPLQVVKQSGRSTLLLRSSIA